MLEREDKDGWKIRCLDDISILFTYFYTEIRESSFALLEIQTDFKSKHNMVSGVVMASYN
jgi:hypothetical protein